MDASMILACGVIFGLIFIVVVQAMMMGFYMGEESRWREKYFNERRRYFHSR